jgi:2-polyprenyl-6-hydroxyphenyl methylase/3-demethylubiquinone-9 3-methyltransferase
MSLTSRHQDDLARADDESDQNVGSPAVDWNTSSHEDFFRYYEQQSLSPETLGRFRAICQTLLRLYGADADGRQLDVLDVGCGAGAQASLWVDGGHRYWGLDVNRPLIDLARKRAQLVNLSAEFNVGTAVDLPYADCSMDICLLPELLEHVSDWRSCLAEAVRVLRLGGLLYLTTTNKLCPHQVEFNLPLYSWYPSTLKRYFEKRALTDWPALANYATYPAVNWFSFFGLRKYLMANNFICLDRFDLIDAHQRGALTRLMVGTIRSIPPLRLLGHVATPYTILVARKIPMNSKAN